MRGARVSNWDADVQRRPASASPGDRRSPPVSSDPWASPLSPRGPVRDHPLRPWRGARLGGCWSRARVARRRSGPARRRCRHCRRAGHDVPRAANDQAGLQTEAAVGRPRRGRCRTQNDRRLVSIRTLGVVIRRRDNARDLLSKGFTACFRACDRRRSVARAPRPSLSERRGGGRFGRHRHWDPGFVALSQDLKMVEGRAITGRPPKSPTTCAPRIPGLAAFGPRTSRLFVRPSTHRGRLHRPGGPHDRSRLVKAGFGHRDEEAAGFDLLPVVELRAGGRHRE